MTTPHNGGPAFPVPGLQHDEDFNGMTQRDYFAAKAMHQFLAGARLPAGFDASEQFEMLAALSYEMADAMLKAREST